MCQQPARRWARRANQNSRQLLDETALVLFDVSLEEGQIFCSSSSRLLSGHVTCLRMPRSPCR